MSLQDNEKPVLTSRQIEVLSLCANNPNLTVQELAEKLGVVPSTVGNILSTTFMRLGANSRATAIAEARKLGLIS